MQKGKEIQIFIFSYNRGELLKNCVESAIYCFGKKAQINIYDDNSNDLATMQILNHFGERGLNILSPPKKIEDTQMRPRGSLYGNMRDAIKNYIDPVRFQYVIFAQDDMQFVRRIEGEDMAYFDEVFCYYPQMVFIYPVFYRGNSDDKLKQLITVDEVNIYFRKEETNYTGFSAVFLAETNRLLKCGWEMPENEVSASKLAAKHNGPMGVHPFPFLAYMPAPKSYRNKRDTLAHGYWDKVMNGCFPINYLDAESVKKMKNQYPHNFPVARDFLVSPAFGPHPWPVFRMQHAPNWLRFLDRLEMKIYKLYRSLFFLSILFIYVPSFIAFMFQV